MDKFYDVLIIGGVFTSFITSILLFTKGRYQLHANRLLGLVIFTWGWYALLYLLVITGWIKTIPWIYRIGSPLYYLIPACSYLYVRNVLLDETRFRKYDWLHFIPAIINFIDLLPFYFTDIETKRAIADAIVTDFNQAYQKGSGLIPAFWHFQLRWIAGVVYLAFQWSLLLHVIRKDTLVEFKKVVNWLLTFTGFNTVIYLGLGTMSVIAWMNLGTDPHTNILASGYSVPTLLQIVGFMGMSVYLFFKPEVLYGIPRVAKSRSKEIEVPVYSKNKIETEVTEKTFDPKLVAAYVCHLEKHLQQQQTFKKRGLTVNELAMELGIPLHHLSFVLNNRFKQRFTDFINGYRVNYICKRIENDDWRSFTLEGLAKEAGFSSRSTFFSAFKKVTGLSPSQYIQKKEPITLSK